VLVVGALVAGCGADNANSFVDGLVRVPLVWTRAKPVLPSPCRSIRLVRRPTPWSFSQTATWRRPSSWLRAW